jgi:hypothetical protein
VTIFNKPFVLTGVERKSFGKTERKYIPNSSVFCATGAFREANVAINPGNILIKWGGMSPRPEGQNLGFFFFGFG